MGKDLNYAMLLECYGSLLTEKQRDIMQLYYYEDLSLSEIAENENITRQGVHDAIKHAEQYLDDFEEKVGFVKKMNAFRESLKNIDQYAEKIEYNNSKYTYSKDTISRYASEIRKNISKIENLMD